LRSRWAADGCGSDSQNGNLGQITIDSAGNIYAADRAIINGFDHARVSKGTPPALPTQPNITSITILPAVNSTYCWSAFTPQGEHYSGAYGAAVDTSTGLIYVSALLSGRLSVLAPSGAATVLGALVPSPVELSVSTTTHIFIVGSLDVGPVKVVSPYGGSDWTAIDGNYSCFATAVDNASETVYAANTGANQVRIIPMAEQGPCLRAAGRLAFWTASLWQQGLIPPAVSHLLSRGAIPTFMWPTAVITGFEISHVAAGTVTDPRGLGPNTAWTEPGMRRAFWLPLAARSGLMATFISPIRTH